jgi:hypothetical protein
MFLRFNFVLLAIISLATGIFPLLLQRMHGGFSLDVCDMKDRSEAARMIVRSGAALIRGGGRNDGGQRGRKDEMVRSAG